MFEAIADSVRELDARTVVVPYLSTGATDSARLRRMGVKAYGLLPFPLEPGDEERMHTHDERVSVESLADGVRLVYEVVRRMTL
jgi:acetylornithine deacetylase/succinyl-diaminopimelate desuccinylase-like protein